MKKPDSILRFSDEVTLHIPAQSGLAIKGPAGETLAKQISTFACPFFVVEERGKFTGYTWKPWQSRLSPFSVPKITRFDQGWIITGPDKIYGNHDAEIEMTPMASTGSLAECVVAYRTKYPLTVAPGWEVLARVRRIVMLDMWMMRGKIAHNYTDVIRLIDDLRRRGLAEGTLLYLPGWFAPFDSRYPLYKPADQLGGAPAFREMITAAKNAGSIIMLHMNFWGYDPHLANDSDLEVRLDRDQIQAHYPNGAPAAWPPYCDLGPCNEIWYMRINHPDWQKLFFRYFDSMVEDYGLEAVFLDQISNVADDPACDFVAATVDLLKRIHSRFPGLLIGCEIVNEFVVSHIPLIQSSWLEDSMPQEAFSPLIRLLYPPDRVRFFPHFFLAAAVPCRYTAMNLPWLAEHGMHAAFALYQEFNRRMGGIPTVRLDYGRFGVDAESLKVLQTAEGAGCNKTI